jgi:hypothetical protein
VEFPERIRLHNLHVQFLQRLFHVLVVVSLLAQISVQVLHPQLLLRQLRLRHQDQLHLERLRLLQLRELVILVVLGLFLLLLSEEELLLLVGIAGAVKNVDPLMQLL